MERYRRRWDSTPHAVAGKPFSRKQKWCVLPLHMPKWQGSFLQWSPYDRLSLSEKIGIGAGVSEILKRLTGCCYPISVQRATAPRCMHKKGSATKKPILNQDTVEISIGASVISRELVKETVNRQTNTYEKLSNIRFGKNSQLYSYGF